MTVEGRAFHRTGPRFSRGDFHGTVYVDSYDGSRSPNMDPCVVSDVLPWFLSFCRIKGKDRPTGSGSYELNSDNIVPGTDRLLSEDVSPGDVVVFGDNSPKNGTRIFVDTILCVESCPAIPKLDRGLDLRSRYSDYRRQASLKAHALPQSWAEFEASRSWRYNLCYSEGIETSLATCLQILGRQLDPSVSALEESELVESFMNGRGFNFIPLGSAQSSPIKRRPGLFVAPFLRLPNKVTRLDPNDGERLLKVIFGQAETLVVDPIWPSGEQAPTPKGKKILRRAKPA
jgi:hypothetical protein